MLPPPNSSQSTRILVLSITMLAFFIVCGPKEDTLNAPSMPKQSFKLCTREDVRRGQWVEWTNSNITLGDAAAAANEYKWNVLREVSGSCQFQPDFSPTLFCRLMTNGVVMFVGDSITWEMYASLVRLTSGMEVSKRVNLRVSKQGSKTGMPVIINVCGNDNVTLVYRWSKHLEGIGKMLEEQFPIMIVMNTGAHYQHDMAHRNSVKHALGLIEGWQQSCQIHLNLTSCPFYWRTTAPGIPKCKTFTKPVNNITKMEEFVSSNPHHNWENFANQNAMALQMLSLSSERLRYEVVDGYEIGIQRPDLRVSEHDCLHNSHPAIADAENAILLHHLRASRTKEDVSKLAKTEYNFSRVTNVLPSGKDLDWNLVNRQDYPYSKV